ncbi:MAG: enoyl-CoA hydratase-related protein [Propionivibrio sp.]
MNAVNYEVDGRVAILTLNRPDALNTVDPEMVAGLLAASSRAAEDADVRAVVVRGAGKNFMAGGDIRWFREQLALPLAQRRSGFTELIAGVHAAVANFKRMDKPVIAAVHGAVAGFGLSMMLAADLALAAEGSYFTLAYSNIALSPDGGATWSLPRHVGMKRAMEIALLGDRFDAVRALEFGLVNRVLPKESLAQETMVLAARLAAGASGALARTKALLNQSFDRTLEAQLLAEQESFVDCASGPDFAEGLAAFLEKRKPVFGKG